MLISVCPIGGIKIVCTRCFDHRNSRFEFFTKTFHFFSLRDFGKIWHKPSCSFAKNVIQAKQSRTELFSTLMCIFYGRAALSDSQRRRRHGVWRAKSPFFTKRILISLRLFEPVSLWTASNITICPIFFFKLAERSYLGVPVIRLIQS